jgi:very-long-chain ceramide synthase
MATSRPSMTRIASTPSAISTMPEQPSVKHAADRRRDRAASNTSKTFDPLAESTHRHTWIIPGTISAVIFILWLSFGVYDENNPFRPFVLLSYGVPGNDGEMCYGKGKKDFLFCAFYAAVFTFVRELTMEMVLRPLARYLGLNKSKQGRFMEQCFSFLQFTISGLYGLVRIYLRRLIVVCNEANAHVADEYRVLLPGVSPLHA